MLEVTIYDNFSEEDLREILTNVITKAMRQILPIFKIKPNEFRKALKPEIEFEIMSKYSEIFYEILDVHNKILKEYFPNAKNINLDLFRENNS